MFCMAGRAHINSKLLRLIFYFYAPVPFGVCLQGKLFIIFFRIPTRTLWEIVYWVILCYTFIELLLIFLYVYSWGYAWKWSWIQYTHLCTSLYYCLREKFRLTHVANNKSLLVLHPVLFYMKLFVIIFLKVFKMDINLRLLKSSKQYTIRKRLGIFDEHIHMNTTHTYAYKCAVRTVYCVVWIEN